MINPFFSIVIPTYNRQNIITYTIQSVINQTFKNWEILIIDDGSTDNTESIIKKIKDPRIKYIYQVNSERSAARNNGIRSAKGDWICFLDSDDEYEKNHLESIYERISVNNSPKFFITEQKTINRKNNKTSIEKTNFDKSNIPLFFATESVVPGRVCIHKEILKKYKFDEEIVIVEDLDLWFRISCEHSVEFIDNPTFIYNIHDENSINVKNNAYLKRLKGLKKTFNKKEKNYLKKEDRKTILNNCYFGIHKYYIENDQIFKSRLSIFKAIILYPKYRLKEKLYLFFNPKNI